MKRYKYNYLAQEQKKHFKMYKVGKRWVTCAITTVALGIGGIITNTNVHADNLDNNVTTSTTKNVDLSQTDRSTQSEDNTSPILHNDQNVANSLNSSTTSIEQTAENNTSPSSNMHNNQNITNGSQVITSNVQVASTEQPQLGKEEKKDRDINKEAIKYYTKIENNSNFEEATYGRALSPSKIQRNVPLYIRSFAPSKTYNALYDTSFYFENGTYDKINQINPQYWDNYSDVNGSYYGAIDEDGNYFGFDYSNQKYFIVDNESSNILKNTFDVRIKGVKDSYIKVDDTLFITQNGIILHNTKFKNVGNKDITKLKYFVLMDVNLNNNDNVTLYSDGLGGAYAKAPGIGMDKKIQKYFYSKLLSDGQSYPINWKNVNQGTMELRNSKENSEYSDTPFALINNYNAEKGAELIKNKDSAIIYATNLVGLKPGQTADLWYEETLLQDTKKLRLNTGRDEEEEEKILQENIEKIDKYSIGSTVQRMLYHSLPSEIQSILDRLNQISAGLDSDRKNVIDSLNPLISATDTDKLQEFVVNHTHISENALNRAGEDISKVSETAPKGTLVSKIIGAVSFVKESIAMVEGLHSSLQKLANMVNETTDYAIQKITSIRNVFVFLNDSPKVKADIVDSVAINARKGVNIGIDEIKEKVDKKITDEEEDVKSKTEDALTKSGASILEMLIKAILTATGMAELAWATSFLKVFITLGAAVMAGIIVKFIWTGKIWGHKLLPTGLGEVFENARDTTEKMSDLTKEGAEELIDDMAEDIKKIKKK